MARSKLSSSSITRETYTCLYGILKIMCEDNYGTMATVNDAMTFPKRLNFERLEQEAAKLGTKEGSFDTHGYLEWLRKKTGENVDPWEETESASEAEMMVAPVDDANEYLADKYDIHYLDRFLGRVFDGDLGMDGIRTMKPQV